MAAVLRDANGSAETEVNPAQSTPADYTNLTIGVQDNLVLTVQIAWSGDPGATTVVLNPAGQNKSLTLIRRANSAGGRYVDLWGCTAPATGAATIRVDPTNSVGWIVNATSYYNAVQSSVAEAFVNDTSNEGTSTTSSVTITNAVNQFTISVHSGPSNPASGNQTVLFLLSGLGSEDGAAEEAAGTGSPIAHTISWGSSINWIAIGCAIAEFVPPPLGGYQREPFTQRRVF